MPKTFGGLPVNNTRDIINSDTKLCQLVVQAAKFGKTTFAGSLDRLTKKIHGKPSIAICTDVGEGGGAMSIEKFGIDYVQPSSMAEINKLIAELATDDYYGGVIFDGANGYAQRFLEPYSLKFTWFGCDKYPTRKIGVPAWGDYQTMGHQLRADFNKFIRLTTTAIPIECRKHLIVTALIREKKDADGNILRIGPDLPGSMMDSATAMFQTVSTIELKGKVIKENGQNVRIYERYLRSKAKAKEIIGDRTGRFPDNFCLTSPLGEPIGLPEIWEQFFVPTFDKVEQEGENV